MRYYAISLLAGILAVPLLHAAPATQPAVGERIPSEDPAILDFHSLGVIDGHANIFRSASPVRDIINKGTAPDVAAAEGKSRMKRLYDLGIRTIIDLEEPDPATIKSNSPADVKTKLQWLSVERQAAAEFGITVIYHPLENKGESSLETCSDTEAKKRLDAVCEDIFSHLKDGGVLFHCAAGHDRTGITAAYIRMTYQRWSVDEAIDEMRRLGHNWAKYSKNGGVSSWDEDHLRVIARNGIR